MKKTTLLCILACAILAAPLAVAVEPAYRGPLGNPEEPATRPYKWMWRGVKALFYQTGDSLIQGNMNFPIVGTVEGLRGVRRGTYELAESTYRGAVGAPAPGRPGSRFRDVTYKTRMPMNDFVEEDILLRNVSDFLFTWKYYPVLKIVDHYPVESDLKVEARRERAREIRARRRAQAAVEEVRQEQAQTQRQIEEARGDYEEALETADSAEDVVEAEEEYEEQVHEVVTGEEITEPENRAVIGDMGFDRP